MSALVEFAMFPTDKGESVSAYVSRIMRALEEKGVDFQLTPMGTIFECETVEEATRIIDLAYSVLAPDCHRVYTTIKMDIRKGQSGRMRQKIASIQKHLSKNSL